MKRLTLSSSITPDRDPKQDCSGLAGHPDGFRAKLFLIADARKGWPVFRHERGPLHREHLYAIDLKTGNVEVVSRHADLMPPVVVGSAHQTERRNFHAMPSVILGRQENDHDRSIR